MLVIDINPHLSSTVFRIVVLCAISIVIIFLILWVLLTRWGLCNQQREDGLQDGVQQLLLQYSLQMRNTKLKVFFHLFTILLIRDSCPLSGLITSMVKMLQHILQTLPVIILILVTYANLRDK